MTDQPRLFRDQERLKLRASMVDFVGEGLWHRLWRKEYNPAYIVKLKKDDIPSIAETYRYYKDADRTKFRPLRLMAVVLSKGPHDQNRRIVAESKDGWVRGLYIALLQRQVREGTEAVQGKCYATLTRLEYDESWDIMLERWTDELLMKRPI